ncbi:MAG: hypothetical protein IPF68_12590 [Bacteroidales bacterium]|nr:hypothetical protein [Bacteroidales bacterium]
MQKVLTIAVFMVLAFQMVAPAQISKEDLYKGKIKSYSRMRNTGMVLTITGAVFTVAGVGLMVDAVNRDVDYYDPYDPYATSDEAMGEAVVGVLCFYAGLFMDTGGIVLWSIGGAKKRSYTKKLNALSLNLKPDPRQTLSLSVRF